MHCTRCGSIQVYPLQHIYLRGSSPSVLTRHERQILESEADKFPDGIFSTNYLHLPLEILGSFDPAITGNIVRDRRAAAYVAMPPAPHSLLAPMMTLAIGAFAAFMWLVLCEPPPALSTALVCLIPGIGHLVLSLHDRFVTTRAALKRWEKSTMCLTCGTLHHPS